MQEPSKKHWDYLKPGSGARKEKLVVRETADSR